MEEERESALVIVVDVSPSAWWRPGAPASITSAAGSLDLGGALDHLHTFLNALLLVTQKTKVGVLWLADRRSVPVPLPSLGSRALHGGGTGARGQENGGVLEDLKRSLLELYESQCVPASGEGNGGRGCDWGQPALSSAYSKSLCVLKQHLETHEEGVEGITVTDDVDLGLPKFRRRRTRVLFLHASADVPSQYIQIMNASFCAQKMGTVVDTFMLGGKDSSFLQQAASITGGMYSNFFAAAVSATEGSVPKKFSLSTYLINVLLPDSETRKSLQLPRGNASTTTLKVTCFLTHKPLDVGFVCSVCLSIFNERLKTCAVCGTTFQDRRALKKKVLSRQQ